MSDLFIETERQIVIMCEKENTLNYIETDSALDCFAFPSLV